MKTKDKSLVESLVADRNLFLGQCEEHINQGTTEIKFNVFLSYFIHSSFFFFKKTAFQKKFFFNFKKKNVTKPKIK